MDTLKQWLPFIVPALLLQLALMAIALMDLFRREQTRGPKWLWAIFTVFGGLFGPIIYLLFGREE